MPENRVLVGRHLVEPRPRRLAIDRHVRERGHSCVRLGRHGAHPGRIDRHRKRRTGHARRRPQQQHAAVADAEVESVARKDRHRRRGRQDVGGNGGGHLTPQRRHRQIDTTSARQLARPRTGGIDDRRGGDRARAGADRDDAAGRVALESGRLHAPSDRRALTKGPVEITLKNPERADEAVARAIRAADDAVEADGGVETRDVVRRDGARFVEALRRAESRAPRARHRAPAWLEASHRYPAGTYPQSPPTSSLKRSSFSRASSDSRTLMAVAYCARKPPVARLVLPAPGPAPRSSSSTSRHPREVRCQARLAPITPAPRMTTEGISVTNDE